MSAVTGRTIRQMQGLEAPDDLDYAEDDSTLDREVECDNCGEKTSRDNRYGFRSGPGRYVLTLCDYCAGLHGRRAV